ncbi:MAG TPA: response regulator, partial [bacterium]|nr:response regulator [bacterium]
MSETKEKKIRVMVVEDSAYMRYVLSEILSEAPDIEVIEKARDGLDALERLETSLPDVITLDIQMPRMDGLTFLSESRKKYRIPTIMISSLTYEGAEDTIKALEMGAVDFVPKPSGVMSLTLEDIKE